jgi:osmotically-inducible protein OsmY
MAASSPVFADNPSAQDVTDARQQSQIATTYALSPFLRDNNLEVSVLAGKATVRGTVEENTSKDLATQIAMGVKGITAVDNQILVKADYVPAKADGARGFGQTIDDASITAAVKSKLLWSKYTESVDQRRNQRWQGDAAWHRDQRRRTPRRRPLASTTQSTRWTTASRSCPRHPSAVATGEHSQLDRAGIADSWITTKVKSTLLYSRNVNSSEIAVSTLNGIVTLSGGLASRAERSLAIELASNVRGVKGYKRRG